MQASKTTWSPSYLEAQPTAEAAIAKMNDLHPGAAH